MMALIEHTFDGEINKVDKAVAMLKDYAHYAEEVTGKPYFVAYSCGKDSDVIRILCALAGVPHELVHSHTTVDVPPTIYYIRTIPNVTTIKPEMSMWELIVKPKKSTAKLKKKKSERLLPLSSRQHNQG